MRKITKIDSVKLACGIQQVLLQMVKDGKDAKYPIGPFEALIMKQHNVPLAEAEKVTEKVINTGIIRWCLNDNCFVL